MIVVIVGPTGIGKSKLGIALAKHYNTEIISGDSVQIYKELDIGSAKVTQTEQAEVVHHMIDILPPEKPFSVADYQEKVRHTIAAFEDDHKLPLIVGGTGFYIKSVLHDFDFHDAYRSEEFDKRYADYSNETLHTLLKKHDTKSAETIHANNRKRVLQALYRALNAVPRSAQTNQNKPLYNYLIIGLTMDRKALYANINNRVDRMFESGLVEEVKNLYETYNDVQSLTAIGYKELIEHFKGQCTIEEAKAKIKTASRRYAKKQYTYFNNQFDTHWIEVDHINFDTTITQAIHYIDKQKSAK